MPSKVVSPEEWVAARKVLLVKEKEATRNADSIRTQIQELPMVKLQKEYIFEGPQGKVHFDELFRGRQQLLIYHFMFGPDWDEGCPSCSFYADHVPDLRHLGSRNTSYAVVSRTPIAKIEAFKARMGWTFPWYSSFGSDFNYDFHVTQDESVAPVEYNFEDKRSLEERGLGWATTGEQQGLSAFFREGADTFLTYSSYTRGNEKFLGTYLMLDITHLGRQDDDEMGLGFIHHDKYEEIKV